ncbi:DUF6095 family protein [Aestuariibaculum sediminum]|uniref:Uncharacterized protein n=1 Tax=Aestuariibaculum sediminum TaxID=2770637 RepID=A0A8J6Q2E3_9FLAO|nr:DUF6095 family protein [Aestuariibaculum sediminum]MBD0833557.1 hypothetical protein [Aestuariibaculum sediminum]
MQTNNRTDKKRLFQGIKTLAFAVMSLFMGPILFTVAESDPDNKYHTPLLIIAILICVFAVFLVFKGIKTIMSSMFRK